MPTYPPTSTPPATSPKSTGPTSTKPTPVRWHWNSALAGALIAAIAFGGFTLLWRKPTPPPIAIHAPPAPVTSIPEPTSTPAPLMVFVSGAVLTPGVYELPFGARVADALQRAGGFAAEANVNAVNQAAVVHDGDQIHVPTLVEEPATPPVGVSNEAPADSVVGAGGPSGPSVSGGPINVNTATLEELDTLPNIGEKRAQDIIANRPYASVDDLDRVPGIGPATLEELRPLVVVE